MLWVGKGKITVASAGTPVPLAALAGPAVKVRALMITYDPSDTSGTIFVKDNNGNIMAAMSAATAQPIVFDGGESNPLDLRNFQIDSGTNGKGPFVAVGTN